MAKISLKKKAGTQKKNSATKKISSLKFSRKIIIIIALCIIGPLGLIYLADNYNGWRTFLNHEKSKYPSLYSIWGIDLSHHNGAVNWAMVMAEKPHFVFLKATEGTTHADRTYDDNRRQLKSLGSTIIGVYHFFSFTSDGKKQAQFFIKHAHISKGDLPPVLDVETQRKMPSKKKIIENVQEWLDAVEQKFNIKPIIYCDNSFYETYLDGNIDDDYPLWIANYNEKPDPDWYFWQHTSSHKIKGVRGNVDRNVFNGDMEDLHELLMK